MNREKKMELERINRRVRVSEGELEGCPAGDQSITVFKGVPFAEPPIGDLRWRPATAKNPWNGIRKCDHFAPAAPRASVMKGDFYQKEFYADNVLVDEDCLYLNIWTPDVDDTAMLPVMIWFHGGGYINGYSYEMEFDGESFCHRNVILVTVAYRLGALGFFAHPQLSAESAYGISGNYALTDCLQALQWLKKNIKVFGGNPENMTIFGQSAGAGIVQCLCTSPKSKGLFAHAILQSGGCGLNTLGYALTVREEEQYGLEVCRALGKTIDELRTMDGEECNRMLLNNLAVIKGSRGMVLPFTPCVDGYYLPKAPGEVMSDGEHHDIDYMTGTVGLDGEIFSPVSFNTTEALCERLSKLYGEEAEELIHLCAEKGKENIEELRITLKKAYSLVAPRAWAVNEIRLGRKPLYVYYFDRAMPGDQAGAFHSSELWYVFGTLDRCWRSLTPDFSMNDYALSRTMIAYWTNFAKYGNPNGEHIPKWTAYDSKTPYTMYFSEQEMGIKDMSGEPIADKIVETYVKRAAHGKRIPLN